MPVIRLEDVFDGSGAAKPTAVAFLYKLLGDRPTAANVSHAKMPTMDEHRAFVERLPYRAWYVVTDLLKMPVGSVYATRNNELGVAILREHQRRGYAKAALQALMAALKPLPALPAVRRGRWIANVSPKNEPSQALFGAAFGGRIVQITYEL